MVACSAIEGRTWRDRISGRIAVEARHQFGSRTTPTDVISPLANEMRSINKVYSKASDFNRRLSVQRAATLGPNTDLNQVMVKNTQAVEKSFEYPSTSSLPIPRSQSVMTPSHIPVLAPRRSERISLEQALSDVWTKDALPYPGMGLRRPEYNIRASANSVIRKLSMASIASGFSKRSMSYTSISQLSTTETRPQKLSRPPPPPPPPPSLPREPPKPKIQRPLVDFHNAPDAFLPEDFELPGPSKKPKRPGAFRTFTITMDRPRSPFFPPEPKAPVLKRSKSVQTPAANVQLRIIPEASPSLSSPRAPPGTGASENTRPDQKREDNAGEGSSVAKRAKTRLKKFLG